MTGWLGLKELTRTAERMLKSRRVAEMNYGIEDLVKHCALDLHPWPMHNEETWAIIRGYLEDAYLRGAESRRGLHIRPHIEGEPKTGKTLYAAHEDAEDRVWEELQYDPGSGPPERGSGGGW